jgi:hypothetical protein
MRIITYRDGKPIGRLMSITVDDLKSRANKIFAESKDYHYICTTFLRSSRVMGNKEAM